MINIYDAIISSVETGEVLLVKYNGGSKPGAVREIVPTEIIGNKVQAKCLTSNSTKTFVIEKLELVKKGATTNSEEWLPETKSTQYASLKDVVDIQGEVIKALGWFFKIEDDVLSLHRYSPKGIPLKGADIILEFNRYSFDAVVDFEREEPEIYAANIRPRKNPWTLRAPSMNTKVFGTLGKVVEVLLEQAVKHAPNR
jgi:hypothetical protein